MNSRVLHNYTWAEVHLDRIAHNIRTIRSRLPDHTKFMAVVKADGYSHGIVEVARTAVDAGAEALAVGMFDEAMQLRHAGINSPILVLTPTPAENVDTAVDHRIALTVFQAEWLQQMRLYKSSNAPLHIHLKLDTGLGRLGIRQQAEWEAMLPLLRASDIVIEGVYTHLSTANRLDADYCYEQFQRFQVMREWLLDAGFSGFVSHCSNSAAALQHPELSLDMVRVGAAIFGIHNCDEEVWQRLSVKLLPTLSLHSEIINVKLVEPGDVIGYDMSYIAKDHEWIATVACGYADGYFRGYGGKHMLVDGQPCPIVGNICMEQTMLRLPKHYPIGTKVTLIGKQQDEEISMYDLAGHIQSIPQQVLTMIAPRVPRIYCGEEKE